MVRMWRPSDTPLERTVIAAGTALGFYLMAKFVNHRWYLAPIEQEFRNKKAQLEAELLEQQVMVRQQAAARVHAERQLRSLALQARLMGWPMQSSTSDMPAANCSAYALSSFPCAIPDDESDCASLAVRAEQLADVDQVPCQLVAEELPQDSITADTCSGQAGATAVASASGLQQPPMLLAPPTPQPYAACAQQQAQSPGSGPGSGSGACSKAHASNIPDIGCLSLRPIGRLVNSSTPSRSEGSLTTAQALTAAVVDERTGSQAGYLPMDDPPSTCMTRASSSNSITSSPARTWRSALPARMELAVHTDRGNDNDLPTYSDECLAGLRKGSRCWMVYATGPAAASQADQVGAAAASSSIEERQGAGVYVCEAGIVALQGACVELLLLRGAPEVPALMQGCDVLHIQPCTMT